MSENTVRTLTGKVVSDKMDKSIVVLIERRVQHPRLAAKNQQPKPAKPCNKMA